VGEEASFAVDASEYLPAMLIKPKQSRRLGIATRVEMA
jgi:hypothetical protein